MARAGLGSPLRKIAGRALALAPVAGGVPNTPYPLCVHVCLCVRLCLVPCDLQRSEIYSQCLCACRRGLCVSRCHWRHVPSGMWPPLAACLPSVAHVLLGWVLSRGHCCLSACVRAMSCSCLLCRSSLDERLGRCRRGWVSIQCKCNIFQYPRLPTPPARAPWTVAASRPVMYTKRRAVGVLLKFRVETEQTLPR